MRGVLPSLPYAIVLEEELPKGHPDKLPKAFVGSEGAHKPASFNNNPKKKS